MSLNFLLLVTSLRQHEQKNRARPCVEVSFISEKLAAPWEPTEPQDYDRYLLTVDAKENTVQELAAHT